MTKTNEELREWEKEFDERIDDLTYAFQMENKGNKSYAICRDLAIKSFISSLLDSQTKELKKEIVEMCEKEKRDEKTRCGCSSWEGCGCEVADYNAALDKVISLITQHE